MDFISKRPLSNGYDAILVIIDCFSKMSLFIQTKTTCTSSELADLFVKHVFSQRGLPDNIIQRNLSTAYHPEICLQQCNSFFYSTISVSTFTGEILSLTQSMSASQRYKQQADKLCLKPPSFNIGDSFWLNARHILKTRPTPKLLERKLGPFKIKSVVLKNAFKLSLPLKWKAIHPVFHVSLLEPAKGLYPGKTHPPPEPVNVQDHLEWEVSCILN
ncbi:uncharacterized protein VP01_4229g1, partial [Puccinia sorghi]